MELLTRLMGIETQEKILVSGVIFVACQEWICEFE